VRERGRWRYAAQAQSLRRAVVAAPGAASAGGMSPYAFAAFSKRVTIVSRMPSPSQSRRTAARLPKAMRARRATSHARQQSPFVCRQRRKQATGEAFFPAAIPEQRYRQQPFNDKQRATHSS